MIQKCRCENRKIMDAFRRGWRIGYIDIAEPWNTTIPMKLCPWCGKQLPREVRDKFPCLN